MAMAKAAIVSHGAANAQLGPSMAATPHSVAAAATTLTASPAAICGGDAQRQRA